MWTRHLEKTTLKGIRLVKVIQIVCEIERVEEESNVLAYKAVNGLQFE
jgi:hypothetical protein